MSYQLLRAGHPRAGQQLVASVFSWLAGLVLLLAMHNAVACGAEGGDQRDPSQPATECEQGAAVHSGPGPSGATANPVDIITGNKFFAQRDARLPGGLSFFRYYNSRHSFRASLGPAWRHGFEVSLSFRAATKLREASAQIVQGDGRRIVFGQVAGVSAASLVARDPSFGSLHHQPMLGPDRRWRWQWRDGSRLYFHDNGQLTMVARASGEQLFLEYAPTSGLLMQVRNRHGDTLRFHYQAGSKLLVAVELPDGQHLRYGFDANKILVSVHRDDISQWQFAYADNHFAALTQVTNAVGKVVRRVDYDDQIRAVYSALADGGQAIWLQYRPPAKVGDPGETLISEHASLTKPTRYRWRYDPVTQQREILSAVGPGCGVCPPVGSKTQYDTRGRLIQASRSDGSGSGRSYDAYWRVKSQWQEAVALPAPLASLQIAYEKSLQNWSQQAAVSMRRQVTYEYGSATIAAPVTRVSIASLAPGRQHSISYAHDAFGRVTAVTETGYAPELNSLRKSAAGRQSGWHFERWKKISRRWAIRYVDFGAAAGLPAFIDGPLPGPKDSIRLVYNKQGRLIAQFGPYRRSWRWQWASNGFLAQSLASEGASESFEYDRFNRLVEHKRDGVRTSLQRTESPRRLLVRSSNRPPLGLEWNSRNEISALFDHHGSRLSVFRPGLGGPERQASDLRLVAPGVATSPGFSAPFSATRFQARPGSGEFRLNWHDDFGRQLAAFDNETGLSLTAYDLADRPIVRIDESGDARVYRYAPNGRLSGVAAPRGGWHQRFQRGRIVYWRGQYQQTGYQLDQHRRVVSVEHRYHDKLTGQGIAAPLVFTRQYDAAGRLVARTLGAGWTLKYQWTHDNELAGLSIVRDSDKQTRSIASSLRWQAFTGGQLGLRSAVWGNGTRSRVELDAQLRLQRIAHESPASSHGQAPRLPHVEIEYGPEGKIVARRADDVAFAYQYDANGWLTGYDSKLGHETWQYNPDGQRVSAAREPAPARAIRVGLTKPVAGAAGSPGYLVSPAGAAVILNSNGRPAWALTKDQRVWRYLYNQQGERIAKLRLDEPGQSRWYVYENRRLSLETDAAGIPLRAFVYLDGRVAAIISFVHDDARIEWLHADQLGVPVASTNEAGRITWQGHFNPFGRFIEHPENTDPGAAMPLRLPGQIFDAETGYHDNYLRTYDPTQGRYLGPDPLGLRRSGLRYAYARNSPLDTMDPLGLYEVDMHYYATFVIAVAAGMSYSDARLIANGNQHVDDNSSTQPIRIDENGNESWLDTFMNRAEVLRDWHFVLETRIQNPDGSYRIERNESTEISNPTSPRLTTLRNWVDSSATEGREAQMFRLGVFSHSYMDTAAHRDQQNRPVPVSPELFGPDTDRGVGHAPHMHYPDYTYNTCYEGVGGGELPYDDPDASDPIGEWPNNESRTLTIQQDMFEIFQSYAGDGQARISWEDLGEVLAQFNAIQENAAGGDTDAESFEEKLTLLDGLMQRLFGDQHEEAYRFIVDSADGGVVNGEAAYNVRQARILWARLFSLPTEDQ